MNDEHRWDRKLNISTGGRDGTAEDSHRRSYEPTPYAVLERIAESGLVGKQNLLVDYGCGKGRVSLFLSWRTGCRSVGIDFNPRLTGEAERNRQSFAGKAQVRFFTESAERYEVPSGADCFYFFNPFSAETLRSVLARITGSWYESPRPMRLLFYYPSDEYRQILMDADELTYVREIDCSDLFPGDERERVLCFETGRGGEGSGSM